MEASQDLLGDFQDLKVNDPIAYAWFDVFSDGLRAFGLGAAAASMRNVQDTNGAFQLPRVAFSVSLEMSDEWLAQRVESMMMLLIYKREHSNIDYKVSVARTGKWVSFTQVAWDK